MKIVDIILGVVWIDVMPLVLIPICVYIYLLEERGIRILLERPRWESWLIYTFGCYVSGLTFLLGAYNLIYKFHHNPIDYIFGISILELLLIFLMFTAFSLHIVSNKNLFRLIFYLYQSKTFKKISTKYFRNEFAAFELLVNVDALAGFMDNLDNLLKFNRSELREVFIKKIYPFVFYENNAPEPHYSRHLAQVKQAEARVDKFFALLPPPTDNLAINKDGFFSFTWALRKFGDGL